METKQIRVRLELDDVETLKRLAADTSLQQIDLARLFLHAALTAVRKNDYRFQWPPRFKLIDPIESANEPGRFKISARK